LLTVNSWPRFFESDLCAELLSQLARRNNGTIGGGGGMSAANIGATISVHRSRSSRSGDKHPIAAGNPIINGTSPAANANGSLLRLASSTPPTPQAARLQRQVAVAAAFPPSPPASLSPFAVANASPSLWTSSSATTFNSIGNEGVGHSSIASNGTSVAMAAVGRNPLMHQQSIVGRRHQMAAVAQRKLENAITTTGSTGRSNSSIIINRVPSSDRGDASNEMASLATPSTVITNELILPGAIESSIV
jgi:hypothetical protein